MILTMTYMGRNMIAMPLHITAMIFFCILYDASRLYALGHFTISNSFFSEAEIVK